MNLSKLFDAQKKLREHINYNGEDRFEKLILALLVEIGECANEQRTWKFWSTDREPRTTAKCRHCGGKGEGYFSGNEYTGLKEKCIRCDGTGVNDTENPLLEEYVDGLHFVLDLCIDLNIKPSALHEFIGEQKKKIGSIVEHFGYLYHGISELMDTGSKQDKAYKMLHIANAYIGLGYRLGFTWNDVLTAYYEKNQINHERQNNGY